MLRDLIDTRFDGNQAEFARAIKKSPAQVNQWLTGHRNLGDAGARHIELVLNLGTGYFGGGPRSLTAVSETQRRYAALSDSDQQIFENAQYLPPDRLDALIEDVRKTIAAKSALLDALLIRRACNDSE